MSHVTHMNASHDTTGKAYLLEVNANPSMAYDGIHTLDALSTNLRYVNQGT